jgi:hypothetical protein
MATAKQTRQAIKRIRFCIHRLQRALDHAHHDLEIINYENYQEQAPCKALQELRERVRETTKDACVKAFIDEIKQAER